MKPAQVISLKTKQVLGVLMGFAVSSSGDKYAIVRPKSRALDLVIEVNVFNQTCEVKCG